MSLRDDLVHAVDVALCKAAGHVVHAGVMVGDYIYEDAGPGGSCGYHEMTAVCVTDAALVAVRSHVNQLADELKARGLHYKAIAIENRPSWERHEAAARERSYRDAERLARAICEEQTEAKP